MKTLKYVTPEITTIEMDIQGSIMVSSTGGNSGMDPQIGGWGDGGNIGGEATWNL